MSAEIHGLMYTHNEAMSYAKELNRARKTKFNLDNLRKLSTGALCQRLENFETSAITNRLKKNSKAKLYQMLTKYAGEYQGQVGGVNCYLNKAKKLGKKEMMAEIAEAEIFSQIKKCLTHHSPHSKSQLVKIAIKFNLPGNLNKKTKNELKTLITKRHLEAHKIVNYF